MTIASSKWQSQALKGNRCTRRGHLHLDLSDAEPLIAKSGEPLTRGPVRPDQPDAHTLLLQLAVPQWNHEPRSSQALQQVHGRLSAADQREPNHVHTPHGRDHRVHRATHGP